MPINITINNFKAIKILLENNHIIKSQFNSKKLLDEFIGCNCVYVSGKPQQIYLNDTNALLGVIKANGYKVDSIKDIEYFIKQEQEPKSRAEIAKNYSNTKRIKSKSFNGLMVAVLAKLKILYNAKKEYFYPMYGTGLFLHYTSKLELEEDIIVVGVENPQVVWEISKYRYLFDENKKYFFLSISEYKTNYQYEWLESFKGEYIHFGDFDLAGINIYLNTIVPRLKNCKKHSFLIPENIYEIIKEKKHTKDYSNQTRFQNIKSKKDLELQKIITFINQNKQTLEQEMLAKDS